jgi:hypothetical protein
MALSGSAAAAPIAKAGAALVDLKPIAIIDGKSISALMRPYGLAAVSAGVAGGGVFVGDQHGGCWQISAEGRVVRRLPSVTERVQYLCVAHGKLFVAGSAVHKRIEAFSAVTGESLGLVETTVDLDVPWCVAIVNDLMVVVEVGTKTVSVWPLPCRWIDSFEPVQRP